jgi:hypothetical protein
LTHSGICTVYALEELEGELYIATEFIDGPTLRDEISSGKRPSPDDVVRTARQLATALASAHERGVTHRDLKPENIMRGGDGRLKILDFGLARIDALSLQPTAGAATEPGTLVGTPAYMSPEQLNGQPADARADVFALGVVLYEYASGVHPFEAATPLATIARVLESQPRPLVSLCPHLPSPVGDVIERCLRKLPAERFSSAGEIVRALQQANDSLPVAGRTRWWRIHQWVILGLYVVSTTVGWQLKDWFETPMTVALFIAVGLAATIGGVLRGHILFTERMNRSMLESEFRRTARAMRVVDVALAALLAADAALFVAWPLTALLTMSLALGIALAAIVLEPTTVRAAFGHDLTAR